jgi:serine/threonine protein kinase
MDHDSDEPTAVVRHVLAVLDALNTGQTGADLSVNTISFLALLDQSAAAGEMQYASPEQARGEYMDQRSLVFSVGVLIFEKLTGRHPFGADGNPRRLARIQKAEMASGVAYFQTISGSLRNILLKCMGPFPEERWSTMAELRTQLEAFVDGDVQTRRPRPVPALPPLHLEPHPASPHALAIAAEREVERRPQSIAGPERATPRSSWLSRLGWMTAGAVLAVVVFMGARHSVKGDSPSPSEAQNKRAAMAPAVVADVETIEDPDAENPVQPASETPKLAIAVEPLPSSDSFDPELGGQAALAAAETCFTDERKSQGIDLGVSLRYGRDGTSQRVYFGAGKLAPAERQCIRQSLTGLAAGAAPDKPTSVSYSFWIGRSASRFKARLE